MERLLRKKLKRGKFEGVPAVRSKTMGAIKSKHNKSTENSLRMALIRSGVKGWKLHPKGIIGSPDFFFSKRNLAVFVDGCFWHRCPQCGHIPKTRRPFWAAKIKRNQERDKKVNHRLKRHGINVLRFWEHELQGSLVSLILRINGTL